MVSEVSVRYGREGMVKLGKVYTTVAKRHRKGGAEGKYTRSVTYFLNQAHLPSSTTFQ
jgi:hypothetical protein